MSRPIAAEPRPAKAKRGLDLIVAAVLLAALSPMLATIGLLVRWSSPGPVLHRAWRIGLNGRPFKLLKFRTMVQSAETLGPGITCSNDARITRLGRYLRTCRLDELPQLWNVLHGDMSLVGPRPEDPRFVALYSERQRAVLSVRPGITGAAQLVFRDEQKLLIGDDPERLYVRDVLPQKLAVDLDYVRLRSFAGDLRLLMRTALTVMGGHTRTSGA